MKWMFALCVFCYLELSAQTNKQTGDTRIYIKSGKKIYFLTNDVEQVDTLSGRIINFYKTLKKLGYNYNGDFKKLGIEDGSGIGIFPHIEIDLNNDNKLDTILVIHRGKEYKHAFYVRLELIPTIDSTKIAIFYFDGCCMWHGTVDCLAKKNVPYKGSYHLFGQKEGTNIPPVEPDKNKPAFKKDHTYLLQDVTFETNSDSILPPAHKFLNNLANYLSANPSISVKITGHTDNSGNNDYNQKLSKRRAEAVKNYLVQKQISPDRIKTTGMGSSKPFGPNNTPEEKKSNRRVEIVLK